MTDQEARDYVEGAFQALKSRGWFQKTGLVPTGVTDREIADFEAETGRKVPALLKAFLKSYWMDFELWGIIHEIDFDTRAWPMSLSTSVKELRTNWAVFWDAADYGTAPKRYGHFLPIGMWESDFLVWDLSRPEDQVNEEDWGESWVLRAFPHDEEWNEALWEEGGEPCAPDFKALLDWYFHGTLIPEFEEDYQVKVNYERLNSYDFLWHYFEDRWKGK